MKEFEIEQPIRSPGENIIAVPQEDGSFLFFFAGSPMPNLTRLAHYIYRQGCSLDISPETLILSRFHKGTRISTRWDITLERIEQAAPEALYDEAEPYIRQLKGGFPCHPNKTQANENSSSS